MKLVIKPIFCMAFYFGTIHSLKIKIALYDGRGKVAIPESLKDNRLTAVQGY